MYKTSFPQLESIGSESSSERLVFGRVNGQSAINALVEVVVFSYLWVALQDSSKPASGSLSSSNCSAVKEKWSGNNEGLESETWTYLVPTHLQHHCQH